MLLLLERNSIVTGPSSACLDNPGSGSYEALTLSVQIPLAYRRLGTRPLAIGIIQYKSCWKLRAVLDGDIVHEGMGVTMSNEHGWRQSMGKV